MGFYKAAWKHFPCGAAVPMQGLKQTALNLGRFCIWYERKYYVEEVGSLKAFPVWGIPRAGSEQMQAFKWMHSLLLRQPEKASWIGSLKNQPLN